MKVLVETKAVCKNEPRGDYGLEGFQLGELYKVQVVENKVGYYIRVYPKGNDDYYETCSTLAFSRFFDVKGD